MLLFDLEVSKLETRSKLLCGLDQLLVPMAASQGSVGHPHLCRRPCVLFLRGQCDDGKDCGFCHLHHAFWSHKKWRFAGGRLVPHLCHFVSMVRDSLCLKWYSPRGMVGSQHRLPMPHQPEFTPDEFLPIICAIFHCF